MKQGLNVFVLVLLVVGGGRGWARLFLQMSEKNVRISLMHATYELQHVFQKAEDPSREEVPNKHKVPSKAFQARKPKPKP